MNSEIRHDLGYERRKAEFKRQYIKRKRRKRMLHNAIVISIWSFMAVLLLVLGIKLIDRFIPKLNNSNQAQEVNQKGNQGETDNKQQAASTGDELSLLTVVKEGQEIKKDYAPQLVECYRTLLMDHRAGEALVSLIDAANKDGCSLYANSGYRTYDRQKELYNAKADVDKAGFSEHELGLAVDVAADGTDVGDLKFANTNEFKWLREHCAEYGFIIRYPKEKESVTKHKFEPWHLRYVGKDDAKAIMKQGIVLEEYKNK